MTDYIGLIQGRLATLATSTEIFRTLLLLQRHHRRQHLARPDPALVLKSPTR
jgi:hypothetical protein